MLQSKLFYKTKSNPPKDAQSINTKLLEQAGFVDQLSAGVYSYLPLGLKVLRKIEKIIRMEMNQLKAQEVFLPALHPLRNYQITKRENIDILYRVLDEKILLGQSHEEVAKEAQALYNELSSKFEVLFDERTEVSAEIKFSEADLIGIPIRLVISKRSLEKKSIELKLRANKKPVLIVKDKLLSKISSLI
jgi:prolyl-tRNA synthetase